jgi:SAM-dependent methyltransferase
MKPSDSGVSSEFFDSVYAARPAWDIGEAQPALLVLLDEFPPTGPLLDVGCGSGDLVLAIARRGLAVLDVDLAAAAIAQAQAKLAAELPQVSQSVEFRVGKSKPAIRMLQSRFRSMSCGNGSLWSRVGKFWRYVQLTSWSVRRGSRCQRLQCVWSG